jgi:hypothetical protein
MSSSAMRWSERKTRTKKNQAKGGLKILLQSLPFCLQHRRSEGVRNEKHIDKKEAGIVLVIP